MGIAIGATSADPSVTGPPRYTVLGHEACGLGQLPTAAILLQLRRGDLAILAVTLVAGAAVSPATAAADNPTRAQPLFRTPGNAAYCYFSPGGLEPLNPVLACWTPNDGFTVAHDKPRGRENQRKSYRPSNRGRESKGYRLRRFGARFHVRCHVTGPSADNCLKGGPDIAFICVSRRSGLTCTNRDGRGFQLGRFRGYKIF